MQVRGGDISSRFSREQDRIERVAAALDPGSHDLAGGRFGENRQDPIRGSRSVSEIERGGGANAIAGDEATGRTGRRLGGRIDSGCSGGRGRSGSTGWGGNWNGQEIVACHPARAEIRGGHRHPESASGEYRCSLNRNHDAFVDDAETRRAGAWAAAQVDARGGAQFGPKRIAARSQCGRGRRGCGGRRGGRFRGRR